MESISQDILIKKFNGIIPLKSLVPLVGRELLDVLKNEGLVFLLWEKNEVHIMKKTEYIKLLEAMKAKSGCAAWFERTKDGRDHMRKLHACVCSISVNKSYMSLEGGDRLKKRLAGQEVTVKLVI